MVSKDKVNEDEVEEGHGGKTKPDEPIFTIAELGHGLELRTRKTVELTVPYAESFLDIAEFVGDRTLRDDHVWKLVREMDAGTFRWEQVNLITCTFANREYRMNGQHTCWARTYADEKKMKGVRTPVQLLCYFAASEQDMRQLYATIDRGAARTRGNVIVSYLLGRAEFPNYSRKILRSLAEGLTLWQWERPDRRKLHTPDAVSYLLLTTYHKTALSVGAFINDSPKQDIKHLDRSPVYAAMMSTFHKAPAIAKEFWSCVRDGTNIAEKSDSRHVLRNYLLTTALTLKATSPDTRSITSEDMYRACMLAWNAFRSHKHLKALQPGKLSERPEPK